MTTFSLNSVNKNFVKYLLFFSFIIILPTVSFSEIYISKIYNKVNVLNLHGNRFFLNEETEIKSGDFFDIATMVQGDEPLVSHKIIDQITNALIMNKNISCANGFGSLFKDELKNKNCVKDI